MILSMKKETMLASGFSLFQGTKTFRKLWVFYLSLILFGEYTNGEGSKEVHVHVGGKENEKIFSYIKIKNKRQCLKLYEASKTFQVHSNWAPIGGFWPHFISILYN